MRKNELMVIMYKALEQALETSTADNPLEAWSNFVDRLDASGRRQIGDDFQYNGKNRFTGKEQEVQ